MFQIIYTKRSLLVIFSIFLLAMLLISSFSNSWIVIKRTHVEYGLWRHCNSTLNQFKAPISTQCFTRQNVSVETKAVQALTILACLLATIATVYACIGLVRKEFKGWLVSLHLAMTGVCMIIGIGIFAEHETGTIIEKQSKQYLLGWSFVLAGSSAAGCFFFAFFGFFSK